MVEYASITERRDRVLILGTGPSLNGVRFERDPNYLIIGVNGTIELGYPVKLWFTLDPSIINRRRLRRLVAGVSYYVAVPKDYGTSRAVVQSHRAPVERGVKLLKRLEGSGPLRVKYGLAEECDSINTGNSVYGALGLAYHMRPKKIAILGMDGTSVGYAGRLGGRPGNLTFLPELFESATIQLNGAGIKVINGSPASTVTCFERFTPREALAWLKV